MLNLWAMFTCFLPVSAYLGLVDVLIVLRSIELRLAEVAVVVPGGAVGGRRLRLVRLEDSQHGAVPDVPAGQRSVHCKLPAHLH